MGRDAGDIEIASGFSAADDKFHFEAMSDRWWETETCWFSFFEASRKLGGWIYVLVRPNIGTVAGGAWLWDDTAYLPWEVLYSANYSSLRMPLDADLADVQLPTGVRIRAVSPLQSYELGYVDAGRLAINLRFDAVMPPEALRGTSSAFGSLRHFDQFGRVTGEIDLYGDRIAIDCLAARDRSWGPRPEHRPRRAAYVSGMVDQANGFLAVTTPQKGCDSVTHGFLMRDGVVGVLRSGERRVRRGLQGWVEEVRLDAVDERGRSLSVIGTPLSRIIINRHTFIDVNSLVEWRLGGDVGWGEDQDIWPVHDWAERRRGVATGQAQCD